MSEKAKNIAKDINEKIKSGDIKMKPKAYFILSALLLGFGLVTTILLGTFFTNLAIHRMRVEEHMGMLMMGRPGLGLFLRHFPWSRAALSIGSLALGVFFLKKLDISYKRSLAFIGITLGIGILTMGFLMDRSGINERMQHTPVGKKMYMQKDQDPRWLTGTVTKNSRTYLFVEDLRGDVIRVSGANYSDLETGDCVRVIGTRSHDGKDMVAEVIRVCGVPFKDPNVRGSMQQRPQLKMGPGK